MNIYRKDVLEILQVKNETLKKIIKNGNLNIRLKEKGYSLIGSYKTGRFTTYVVEKCDKVIIDRCLNISNYNVNYEYRHNTGIYCILSKGTKEIYIGSTVRNFRERFQEHFNGNDTSMKHTYNLLHNGGEFYILYDMIGIEDKTLIRMVENEFIQYFKYYTDYNVINKMNESLWKGKSYKQKYKNIKIKLEDYNLILKLLENNGFEL